MAAHLRKNIEQARTAPGHTKPAELDLAAVDCSDSLCRVEVRATGASRLPSIATVQVLQRGMGNLSMRPSAPGKPPVYYVAAPGQRLPRMEP